MTTRNITQQFERLRSKAKSSHDALQAASSFRIPEGGSSSLLDNNQIDSTTSTNLNHHLAATDIDGLMMYQPPKWVDIVDTIKTDIERIDQLTQSLDHAYSQRLKVSFGNELEEKAKEELIENITHQTTILVKGIETKIKSIAFCDDGNNTNNANNDLSTNEKNVRLNVMRNLGSVLQKKSKAFKQQQRDYLQKLQKQQHIGNDLFAEISTSNGGHAGSSSSSADGKQSDGDMGLMLEVVLDQGLSTEQQLELEEIEMRADEREKEIIHLAQNINELASLFQELNVLVIEQGTILDRIDYNVEQTLINVQQGRVEIEKAEEMSKSNWILKFMIILLIIILLEVVALVVKFKLRGR